MFKKIFLLLTFTLSFQASAAIKCVGTIEQVYKWHTMERVSVMLSSTNRWINMPTKSDESMALLAFASNKPVEFYWSPSDITSCTDGWGHNRSLEGWWLIKK